VPLTDVADARTPAAATSTDPPKLRDVDVVIPTVGRRSLDVLLRAIGAVEPPWPGRIIVVDDSADRSVVAPLLEHGPAVEVVRTAGRQGPAAARNAGWRASQAPFIAFLDDDVVPEADWAAGLLADLAAFGPATAAAQARITVPHDERADDWARNTARLGDATWITADLVVRRAALEDVGGFDERFRRAYREDTDLALRLLGRGWHLARGERRTLHPVRAAPWWVSVSTQRGNADDVLLDRLHGPDWRNRLGEPRGRFRWHVASTVAAASAFGAAIAGRRLLAALASATWLALTADFAARRIRPGPRTAREVAAMLATSAAIPPVALWHRAAGQLRHRRV
jgi:glycosyltransferase involved in cell wall biosynthesis